MNPEINSLSRKSVFPRVRLFCNSVKNNWMLPNKIIKIMVPKIIFVLRVNDLKFLVLKKSHNDKIPIDPNITNTIVTNIIMGSLAIQ